MSRAMPFQKCRCAKRLYTVYAAMKILFTASGFKPLPKYKCAVPHLGDDARHDMLNSDLRSLHDEVKPIAVVDIKHDTTSSDGRSHSLTERLPSRHRG